MDYLLFLKNGGHKNGTKRKTATFLTENQQTLHTNFKVHCVKKSIPMTFVIESLIEHYLQSENAEVVAIPED